MGRRQAGFTLMELGISLIVLSLLASGVLTIITQKARLEKQSEIKMKMDAIESALLEFRKANGYLPCPANAALTEVNANFGYQGATTACVGGSPAATFNDGVNTVGGMVPVRNLKLPDNYAYDPWGGRFLYVIDVRARNTTTFATTRLTSTGLGSITVKDATGGNRTTAAAALVLSFGPNGHGAYQAGGTQKFVSSSNTHEQENCGCDDVAPTSFNPTFYMHPATTSSTDVTNSFDDIVRYYTRAQLNSATDVLIETP